MFARGENDTNSMRCVASIALSIIVGLPSRTSPSTSMAYASCSPRIYEKNYERSEKWDAWLANDLDGAQAVIRCACAASEPALAEEMIAKANFSCGAAEDLTGVRADLRKHLFDFRGRTIGYLVLRCIRYNLSGLVSPRFLCGEWSRAKPSCANAVVEDLNRFVAVILTRTLHLVGTEPSCTARLVRLRLLFSERLLNHRPAISQTRSAPRQSSDFARHEVDLIATKAHPLQVKHLQYEDE